MIDQFIIDTPEAIARVAATANKANGLPCCGCHEKEDPNCPCDKHRYADGRPAPHKGSCTLTSELIEPHPTDKGLAAYRVHATLRELANKGSDLLNKEEQSLLADKVAVATTKTVDWFPDAKADVALDAVAVADDAAAVDAKK